MAGRAFHKSGMFSLTKMSNLVLLYHVAIFCFTLCVALLDLFVIDGKKPASMRKFGGRWRFLTVWNLDIQLVFFGISLIHDAVSQGRRQPMEKQAGKDYYGKFQKLVSTIFAAVVYPLGMFVSLTFWVLYAVDRELVFPRAMDQYVPTWINHCLHTNIVLYILLEIWLVRHEFPSVKVGLSIVTVFVSAYLVWVHFLYYMSGAWVYPILQKLSFHQRYLFMAAVVLFIYPIYLSGDWLHRKRWGSRTVTNKKLSC